MPDTVVGINPNFDPNYESELDIIETNLIPSGEMKENICVCTIIIDSTQSDTADIYTLNDQSKLNGHAMFTHHYLVTKDGSIFKGREEKYVAEIDDKFGLNVIGIMIEGDFNKTQMNVLQLNNMMALIYDICARNPYIGSSVYTHSELNKEEYSNTPGELFPYVEFKNRIYRNYISITDTSFDVTGDIYYIYGSRALEYQVPNMTGTDIYQLKVFLIQLGYTINNLNGIFDTELKEVINRYFTDYMIRRESYYSSIMTTDNLLELQDRVINLLFDHSETYRRYLKIKNPLMFGQDIRVLKEKLWTLGLYEGELNNLYDEAMSDAVSAFERRYGILEDGEVGSLVFSEIMKCVDYTFKRVLELDEPLMEGADVEIIQKALYRKGYSVDINGYYDMRTYTAVCNFQLDNNLTVDGRVDQYLFDEILKGYNE